MKFVFVWYLAWIYRLTMHIVFNVIFNFAWLARIFFSGQWRRISREMDAAVLNLRDYSHLCLMYRQFQYHYDGLFKAGTFSDKNPLRYLEKWPVWTSCVRVFFYRGLRGNCNDSVRYAKWLVKKFNRNKKGIMIPPIETETIIYVPIDKKKMFLGPHYFLKVTAYGIPDLFDIGKVERMPSVEEVVRRRLDKKYDYVIL